MELKEGSSRRVDAIISEGEELASVGRKEELNFFNQYTKADPQAIKVLHHYGMGGIGKTYLLNEYRRFAEKSGFRFLKIDSRDFIHTPLEMMNHLLSLLDVETGHHTNQNTALQSCLQTLNSMAKDDQIIIAIDSYEYMDDLDRWFREMFVRQLQANMLIVLAGRRRLKGEWEESPAWRKVIKQIKLSDFTFAQTRSYLNQNGIEKEQLIRTIWQFTEGHPLTLSLATLVSDPLAIDNYAGLLSENTTQILMKLAHRWLQEVEGDELLHNIIEAASLFHTFDQASLSTILNKEVTMETFNKLLLLSFIRTNRNGWSMHDLIRDAVKVELKHRNPEQFTMLSERIAEFYYHRTISTRSVYDIAQFFYHLGDEFIQSTFFQKSMDTSMYLEPVGTYNFREVIAFFDYKRENVSKSEAAFYNRRTNKSFHFHASLQHNKKEMELLGTDYIETMGYDTAKLLKDKDGQTVGLSVIVPINKSTLPHLTNEPVSRAYFKRLNESDRKAYTVPKDENAGWFIRMLDYKDPQDTAARSFSLYNLFPLLLSGGKIIVSTPLPFFQELITNFGFKEIPSATHYDYGENYPSPTYILDLSGPKLAIYLKQFLKSSSLNNQMKMITDTFSFTDREQEIATLILEEKSNMDIANQLFVAEITVKKHVSRILKKANVKNRTQLIKRIMELI